jgi:dihydrolipoamide dehydrogenase
LCAPQGYHLALLLALAVQRELTVHVLLRLPFYHPTLEVGLRSAVRDAVSKLGGAYVSDLAYCVLARANSAAHIHANTV